MASFTVMWQFPKTQVQRGTYDAPDLQTLLRMLQRAEDVTISSTEKLFVHYHASTGEIIEVVSHEAASGFTVVNHQLTKPTTNIVPIGSVKKSKPRVRLTTPAVELPFVTAANGLYKAYPAR